MPGLLLKGPRPMSSSTLSVNDKSVELPVMEGTIGPSVIDISKLYGQTGMFTYDPGFTSTAATESKITYIDGDQGILLYRGYPIDQLAEHGDFLETCYLLLYGELPTAAQKADFDYRVTRHTMVHEQMMRFFQGFRRDAHPMAIMVACVGALSAFYHDSTDIYDPRARIMQKTTHEVLTELGIKDDPLLDVAMELEQIALKDGYFVEKKLYPNIDFYSGITLKAMGFPTSMFTVLFALARTVGWIAQWKEMIEDPSQKIGRPRQLYTGARRRDYLTIAQRG